jgi:hypothetical protein
MRTSVKILVGISSLLLTTAAADAKKTAQLIPIIPFPGATSTTVFGIADDNNTITGSYIDTDGLTHGFYGTLDGNYTSFDFGNSGSTQARAISGDGNWITGFSNIADVHCNFPEWEMKVGSDPKQITKDGTQLFGEAQGFNSKNTFAGDYCDTGGSGTIFGQLGKKGKWKSDVTTPFESAYTGERGVNTDGTVVGFYVDSDTALQIGTVIKNGTTSQVINPGDGETYTVMEGINDSNIATGQWGDTSGFVHGFSYNVKKAKFTEIDDPNAASFTQAWGINKAGLIAVSSDAGAYIYCDLKPAQCPSTGAKAITITLRETTVKAGKQLSYGDVKTGGKHAPIQNKLPKGAAMQ